MTIEAVVARGRHVSLFAGPGGVDLGAGLLGVSVTGVDLDADACATARAAGYARVRADVTALDPDAMRGVTGAVITPPCPTWSVAGLRTGCTDLPHVLAALTALGDAHAGSVDEDAWTAVYDAVADVRSALVAQALRWALRMPHLQWLVCEQVPSVAPVWAETAAELACVHYWQHAVVVIVGAEHLGLPARRNRSFLLARRHHDVDLTGLPFTVGWETGRHIPPTDLIPQTGAVFPTPTMADALGWPVGEHVNTRGARKTAGGNVFSADGVAWCLTEKARTWHRVSDRARLTPADAGRLVGFGADYPWSGSRSKQFLQAADVIAPPVAAAVIGAATGRDWQTPVREYLADLYPATTPAPARQPTLWETAA